MEEIKHSITQERFEPQWYNGVGRYLSFLFALADQETRNSQADKVTNKQILSTTWNLTDL